jgi:hypothetical protein
MTITCEPIDATGGSPAYSALAARQARSAHLYNGTARPLGSQSGRRFGSLVVSATSTDWSVAPGSCIVDPAFTSTQGAYEVASDAIVTGSMTAADATNPRKDIVYVKVNDDDIDGSGSRNAQILYAAGTPNASPVPPATPARSLVLGTITVPASGGGSPTTALGQITVASGGLLPVASSTVRDALITNPIGGMSVYREDTDSVEVYNGATWDTFVRGNKSRLEGGTFTVTFAASPIETDSHNFTTAFSSAPIVVLDIQPFTNNTPLDWGLTAITTTGFTYYVKHPAGTNLTGGVTGRYIALG